MSTYQVFLCIVDVTLVGVDGKDGVYQERSNIRVPRTMARKGITNKVTIIIVVFHVGIRLIVEYHGNISR